MNKFKTIDIKICQTRLLKIEQLQEWFMNLI